MTMARQKPILITGVHRSGTTWVGKMLAASPAVGYIREPFGLSRRPGLCGAPFKYWFTCISRENEQDFYEDIKKTIEFRFNGKGCWHSVRSWRAVAGTAKIYLDFQRYRVFGARPLLKDPIAIFSANWLAERFDMDVVVLVRHPAAFVGSLKLLNWQIPFRHLLNQPLLMQDRLYPFEAEIRKFACQEQDLVDQAALFWKVTYSEVLKYREQYPDWIYLRHEDISHQPLAGFRTLFQQLNLDLTRRVERTIQKYSSASDCADRNRPSPENIKRDSLANITYWKTRLTPSEIARVRSQVEEVSRHFYSSDEW